MRVWKHEGGRSFRSVRTHVVWELVEFLRKVVKLTTLSSLEIESLWKVNNKYLIRISWIFKANNHEILSQFANILDYPSWFDLGLCNHNKVQKLQKIVSRTLMWVNRLYVLMFAVLYLSQSYQLKRKYLHDLKYFI